MKTLFKSILPVFFCFLLDVNTIFAQANVGIVNEVTGTASRFRSGGAASDALEVGSKIYINDRIVTSAASKVQLVFRNDSVLTLGPDTEFIVDQDKYDRGSGKRESIFTLAKGKVRSVVSKTYSQNNSRFEIHTRTATAGVRGTENITEFQENPPLTNVYGIRDTTFTRNINPSIQGELELQASQGARVRPDQPPEPFEFEFTDPTFLDVVGETTIPGSDDVENDLELGSLEGTPQQGPGQTETEGDLFPDEDFEDDLTPPVEQDPGDPSTNPFEFQEEESQPEQTQQGPSGQSIIDGYGGF